MAFMDKTRRKVSNLGAKALTVSNPLVWDIPKVGLLSGIMLDISITTGAVGPAPHAMGFPFAIRNVRVTANSGIDIYNVSGCGYHYLLRRHLEAFGDAVPSATAVGTALAVGTTYDASMYIPISLNSRDPLGLFMLQNEATLLQLSVEMESAVTLMGAGGTLTGTVTPYAVTFTVPVKTEDWPPLNVVHQIVEETRAISGAGAFEYKWPRGNTYLQLLHGVGIAESAADNFTAVNLTVNQSDRLWDMTPNSLDIEYGLSHGAARPLGVVPIDFLGTSGLGTFGSARDMLYSAMVTEIATNITAVAAGTLYTVRRQLVALKG